MKELNDFAPVAGEYEQIDREYKRLANSGQLVTATQQTLELLSEGEEANLLSQLHAARHVMSELVTLDPSLSDVMALLEDATIQLTEASNELRHYGDRIDLDHGRLHELEQRLSRQISLARKHHVKLEALAQHHQQLLQEQEAMEQHDASSISAVLSMPAVWPPILLTACASFLCRTVSRPLTCTSSPTSLTPTAPIAWNSW